jgi:hypothetical protein
MTTNFPGVLPITHLMTQTKQGSPAGHVTDESTKKHCSSCEKPAGFITPLGLLCADHAMAATLNQEKGDDRWMPVPVNNTRQKS